MQAMNNRKNHFAIKIMIGPDDGKDQKIQKDLQEEDVAPFLPEVDEEKAENAQDQMQAEDGLLSMQGKPGSLKELVKADVMKKKSLSK